MKKHLHVLRLFVLFSAACLSVGTCNSQVDTNQSASLDQTAPIQIGQPIHAVDPKIPKELRKKNVSAVFSATISSSGESSNLTALNGDPAFTKIALDAVRQWRYSPPMQDGKAVDAKVYVLISADHGKVLSSVEPELPVPTQPREPLKELFTSERLFRVGAAVKAPKVLNAPDPEYSELARKAKYQGVTVLGVIVGPDGNPQDVWVVKKLGLALDRKAIDVVRTWKFEPATRDGEPVPVLINVEVNFRLY
jgi:TonB family protein